MSLAENEAATFDVHGVVVEVRSNRTDLVELIARRLKFFAVASASPSAHFELRATEKHVVEPPAGAARPVYEPETGEVLYTEADDELYVDYGRVRAVCRPAEGKVLVSVLEPASEAAWAVTRPLFTLPLLELLKRRGIYGLHAAGVTSGDRAILLAGGTGAGKTTLSLALAQAGFDFLGDDMLFVSGDVLAFPDELDLSDTTVSFFPEVEALLWPAPLPGASKRQLPPDRLDCAIAERAHPSLLLFPRIAGGPRSAVEPLTRDEALLELAPNVLLTDPASSQGHLDALGRLVQESRCFRLAVGEDLDEAVAVARELLV